MKLSEALELLDGIVIAIAKGNVDISQDEANAIVVVSDALRWRKWPEEKPTEDGHYLCRCYYDRENETEFRVKYICKAHEQCVSYHKSITHWLPINGPEVLP